MSAKFAVPLAALLMLVFVSGCINTAVLSGNRPEDVVKTIPEIQEFIAVHPDFDLAVNQRSEGYIRGKISEMSERCGPFFKLVDYWQVLLDDPIENVNITVWIEKSTNQLACLYGEGVGSPPAIMPGPEKIELTITGFSNLDVNPATTEFSDGRLYLTIGNPNVDRMTIKKVSVSYLDDELDNVTNSGLLSQGESFRYVFDLSGTVDDDKPFWISVDVLYDRNDMQLSNQRNRGFVIGGMDTGRILQCSGADFEIERYNFLVGTRIFSVNMRNTGDIDLDLRAFFRKDGVLEEVGETFTMGYGESKFLEYEGLTRLTESVLFISDACPGAYEVISVRDISGV
jgi:hypothetical protein